MKKTSNSGLINSTIKFFSIRRFAIFLAFLMIAFEVVTVLTIRADTPKNYTWLGSTITNTSDQAVYLNYLNQSKTSFLIKNLYNAGNQVGRFDPFWSIAGLFVRVGLNPIIVHEFLRFVCTIILAFAIYAATKSATSNEKQARIGSLLMISGLSTGWLYLIWMAYFGNWTPTSLVPADLTTEFAIAPIILGGAHMILSVALQLFICRWLWNAIALNKKRDATLSFFAILYHVSYHPYFIPFYFIFILITIFWNWKKIKNRKSVFKTFLLTCLALIPGSVYYIWFSLQDASFRTHHLQNNILPLDPPFMWFIILLPFIIIITWALLKRPQKLRGWYKQTPWALIWLFAAIICMFAPLPWTRKYTQGLLPVFIIITLPLWLYLYNFLTNLLIKPIRLMLIFIIIYPFLNLYIATIHLQENKLWSVYFYVPTPLMQSFNILKDSNNQGTAISTNIYTNLWIPAYANRPVWIGHNHETPDFEHRHQEYYHWLAANTALDYNNFLDSNHITALITTDQFYTDRATLLLTADWHKTFEQNDIALWIRSE